VELPYHGLAYGSIGTGPPILIYQIGLHETRILIDIPNAVHDRIISGGSVRTYIEETVVPTLPKIVQPKVISALDSGRLRSMPNEWLPAQASKTPGVLIIGDASNIRHPLTGSGMTVALQDIVLLRDVLDPASVALKETDAVHKKLQSFNRQRKAHSTSLNILAQALYTLFVADGKCSIRHC
jgi:squalene monooxygenase